MTTKAIPIIDYARHPAFQRLVSDGTGTDHQEDALISDIDTAYREICRSGASSAEMEVAFDLAIGPKLDALLVKIFARGDISAQFSPFLMSAFGIARSWMRDDLNARTYCEKMTNSGAEGLKGHFRDGLSTFRNNGYYSYCDAAISDKIWRATFLERVLLRAKARKYPDRHTALALHSESPAVRIIKKMAAKSGLVDFISTYMGRPMEFMYAALEYNHGGQRWYEDCYADVGLPTSRTKYMHFDASSGMVKILIYLQSVEEKDGPFRYVRGSHHWQRSPLAIAIQKGFDQASTELFEMTQDKLDYTLGYYRPRFKLGEHRTDMMRLPKQLRGSTHFGDDILDESELSNSLLEDEHSFVGPAGTFVVFDGSYGIHRGGQAAENGKRWVIQLAFQAKGTRPPSANFPSQKVRFGRLAYLRGLAKMAWHQIQPK
jgi:hypothetical protein